VGKFLWTWYSTQSVCDGVFPPLTMFVCKVMFLEELYTAGCLSLHVLESQ
jgi:hypothetical protein